MHPVLRMHSRHVRDDGTCRARKAAHDGARALMADGEGGVVRFSSWLDWK